MLRVSPKTTVLKSRKQSSLMSFLFFKTSFQVSICKLLYLKVGFICWIWRPSQTFKINQPTWGSSCTNQRTSACTLPIPSLICLAIPPKGSGVYVLDVLSGQWGKVLYNVQWFWPRQVMQKRFSKGGKVEIDSLRTSKDRKWTKVPLYQS